jgi:hypothetical protein
MIKTKYWNYRVIESEDKSGDKMYQIYEVYYDKKDKPHSWSAVSITPIGSSRMELFGDLQKMTEATLKPVMQEMSSVDGSTQALVEIKGWVN